MRKQKHTKCSVEGCDGTGQVLPSGTETFPKGLCTKHYARVRTHGSTEQARKYNVSLDGYTVSEESSLSCKSCWHPHLFSERKIVNNGRGDISACPRCGCQTYYTSESE